LIIGHGDIASVLPDHPNRIYFASGVSNSQETRIEEFTREIDLLREQDREKHLVYFSSLAIFYANTPYTRHKKYMEVEIASSFADYTIVRLGNITWGTNPHTLINYFRNKVANHESIEIREEYRYIVDKDEFLHWIDLIPDWNCEMNITGQRMTIKEIVNKYVYLGISKE
jgi:hypothetical protein